MLTIRSPLSAMRSHLRRLPVSARFLSLKPATQRLAKLKEVYAPLNKFQKGSEEYFALGRSGKVWENYFQPQDTKPYDKLQQKYKDVLAEIDEWRELLKPDIPDIGKALVAEYAHQSVVIENNPIPAGESFKIYDMMDKELFAHTDLAVLPPQELLNLPMPHLSPTPSSPVIELMNHIVASQWIAVSSAKQPGTPGLNEKEMQQLCALAIRGTDSEVVFTNGWGGRIPLGGYRKAPIGVRSNPLRIFPYPQEVEACMQRFFQWRDARHYDQDVHPLIHACQLTCYLVQIHPFPDGNGRTSRMMMHDYMLRQGYLPVVIRYLEREDYLRMISDSQDGDPEEFVLAVLKTQLEQLQTFHARQHME